MTVNDCFGFSILTNYISKSLLNSVIEMFMDQSGRDMDLKLLPLGKQMKILQTHGLGHLVFRHVKVIPCYMYLSEINVPLPRT